MSKRPPNTRFADEPYEYLCVGDLWFLPWEAPHPTIKGLFTRHLNYWRTPHGERWTTNKIYAWAKKRGEEFSSSTRPTVCLTWVSSLK